MKKAVFMDRDGVICKEKNHLYRKEDLELIENSAKAIRLLNANNFLSIVISNQSVVALGLCSEEEVIEINNYMKELLSHYGARIDGVYFCPHHTKGNNSKYVKICECRKPLPGMILQAKRDFGIDNLSECFMIGDKTIDIKAGILAGCKTILVKTGYGGEDGLLEVSPIFVEKDLYNAVSGIILK